MSALDIKLMRDFGRLWAQGLAIALVAAAGVITLLTGVGTFRALDETQQAYYERYNFADIFATATRAPLGIFARIADLPDIARAEARIEQTATLDIVGMEEPATGRLLSIPDVGEPQVNRLFVVEGRLPETGRPGEVAISRAFAEAHGFRPGDSMDAIMGGIRRSLVITGIALSPEFIYSIGPGDIVPDNRRFGVVWMRYSEAAAAYDLGGAFNSVVIQLGKDASARAVIDAVDAALRPYGGRGAHDRSEQMSHAFLDAELVQLRGMSTTLPPIFLGVAAFLVNMTLARLVALEREQIGLLKALGYRPSSIAWHYVKLSLLIAFVGILIGWGLGAWAGRGMATLYAEFYKFPFLLFQDRPDVFALSGLAALVAAVLGSVQAVASTLRLSPAAAMAPPAPAVYRRFFLEQIGLTRHLPQGVTMALRNFMRRPVRTLLTILGIGFSTGLMVGGLFSEDAVEYLIEATYFHVDRQHASIVLAGPVGARGMESIRRLPGVMAAEAFRSVPVKFTNGLRERRASLTGKPLDATLSRVVDKELEPVKLPEWGLALSETLAALLDVQLGDTLEAELLDGSETVLQLPVTQITEQFIGLGAYMEIGALNRALGEGFASSGAHLMVDPQQTDALYAAAKSLPAVAGITLQRRSLEMFRDTIGENMGMSRAIFVGLAVVITFGVVYNSMRIQLSERARELASLRVLGFTRVEVSFILLTEIAIMVLLAVPLGWLIGYGAVYAVVSGVQSDLFTIPMVVSRSSYASAALVTLVAAAVSAAVVARRVAGLDMIAVLKTRE